MIRLGTVTDQMLFDKDRIAAAAGKPVEVVFENGDIMPHNFVVTRPGVPRGGRPPRRVDRHRSPAPPTRQYVPRSDKDPRQPAACSPPASPRRSPSPPRRKPGVYPYVCTYPGHWRRMYGAFYVVEDLRRLPRRPRPATWPPTPCRSLDDLLKDNRPRKEWTYDDLASAVEGLDHGRSFANARRIFEVASCVSCHKLNGVGAEVGPDLAQLDPKMTRPEILRSLVEPSAKVDDKYRTHVSPPVRQGRHRDDPRETPTRIQASIENPLAKSEPVDDRQGRHRGPIQVPHLDHAQGAARQADSREEILDLVAYLIERGDAKAPDLPGPARPRPLIPGSDPSTGGTNAMTRTLRSTFAALWILLPAVRQALAADPWVTYEGGRRARPGKRWS